jgi:Tfp pilus assembly protein PilV
MPLRDPTSSRSPRYCGRGAPRDERGATIMEVIIAATLLSFVVLGAIAAISRGMIATNHARMITLSSQVLQSSVEDLRLKNYAVIKAYAAQSQPVNFTSSITSELLSSNFTSTMQLSANFTTLHASTATQLGMIAVEVTISWQENGSTFTRSARTYFSEKGLSDYIYVGF